MLCPKQEKRRGGHGLIFVQVEIGLRVKGGFSPLFFSKYYGISGAILVLLHSPLLKQAVPSGGGSVCVKRSRTAQRSLTDNFTLSSDTKETSELRHLLKTKTPALTISTSKSGGALRECLPLRKNCNTKTLPEHWISALPRLAINLWPCPISFYVYRN